MTRQRHTLFEHFVNMSELYDVQTDLSQKVNVIEQFPEIVEKMKQAYDKWWAETLPLMVNENAKFWM